MEASCGGADSGGGEVNEFAAVVTDIREESRVAGRQRWQMALDRTEFRGWAIRGCWRRWRGVERDWWFRCSACEVMRRARCGIVVEKPLAAGTAVTGRVGEAGV